MAMNTAVINESATYALPAGQALEGAAYRALALDDGALKWPDKGAVAFGIAPGSCPDAVKAGEYMTVQIKDIGYWVAGGAFACGAELATDEDGMAVAASAGDYVMGVAITGASGAGAIAEVQITKSGYKYI